MKLAIVIERFHPAGGGAERSTAQIVEELTRRGHTVTLITGASPDGVDLHGAAVRRLAKEHASGPVRLLRFARWARQQVRDKAFDVSLSVTTAAPATVIQPRSGTMRETLARNVAMRGSASARWRKQATLLLSPKHQLLLALERKTLRDPMVRRFVAVSRYGADQLAAYDVPLDRVEVIPNAASMPRLTDEERQKARQVIRAGFDIPPDEPVYLFVAQNPRLKGVDTLLRALQMLKHDGVPATVLLVGVPRYGVHARTVELQVRDRVRIVGASGRMAELYAASDVTVLPTWYDPASKVVIESLMMGVPAITTAFNGAADFVVGDGFAPRGWVIADPRDAGALAAAMRTLADPDERKRCADATAGLAQTLSMQRHVDRLEAVLQTAAEQVANDTEASNEHSPDEHA